MFDLYLTEEVHLLGGTDDAKKKKKKKPIVWLFHLKEGEGCIFSSVSEIDPLGNTKTTLPWKKQPNRLNLVVGWKR